MGKENELARKSNKLINSNDVNLTETENDRQGEAVQRYSYRATDMRYEMFFHNL